MEIGHYYYGHYVLELCIGIIYEIIMDIIIMDIYVLELCIGIGIIYGNYIWKLLRKLSKLLWT